MMNSEPIPEIAALARKLRMLIAVARRIPHHGECPMVIPAQISRACKCGVSDLRDVLTEIGAYE